MTPQTSFLANQYMKLHQPGYRHARVVVDGFGHSDLLIGEESYKKVFPHIISHIRLAEQGKNSGEGIKESKYSKDVLSWGDDPFGEESGGFWNWVSPLVFVWLFLLFVLLLLSFFM